MSAKVLCLLLILAVAVFGSVEVIAQSDDSPKATEEDWTLERVLAMGRTEIIELWKTCPTATLEEMNGHFLGLIPSADDPVYKKRIDSFMYNENSARGYWLGKAYKKTGDNKGEGYNRWRHPGGKMVHGQYLHLGRESCRRLTDG